MRRAGLSLAAGDNLLTPVRTEHAADPVACVLVDEAQFLTIEQVWQATAVTDTLDIPVLCYGLRTDFRAQLFPGSAALLALADTLTELKTICHCGRKAIMNLRVDAAGKAVRDGAQVEIGGNDRYLAMCRRHFMAIGIGCKRGAPPACVIARTGFFHLNHVSAKVAHDLGGPWACQHPGKIHNFDMV